MKAARIACLLTSVVIDMQEKEKKVLEKVKIFHPYPKNDHSLML
jgi:hypothetical protein